MSVQTAYSNQPYANPIADQGWAQVASIPIPLSQYLNGAATPGMTQMPNVPQPPFLNSTASPTAGLSPVSDIPPPWQIAPGVMGINGTPAYQPAQSIPISAYNPYMDPLSEIPPPHLVAPWLTFQRPSNPMPPYPNQNLNPQNAMQGQQPPQQPQAPPQPPPQPQAKGPTANLGGGELSDETIESLNKRLNSPSVDVRADAAIDLFKILDTNRDLADSPVYSKYVNAFVEKIMTDPSPIVRSGGELILQMGIIQKPTDKVTTQLRELSKRRGMTGEEGLAGSLLGSIEGGTLRKSKSPTSTAPQSQTDQPATTPSGTNPTGGAQLPDAQLGGQQAFPPGMQAQGMGAQDLAGLQAQQAGMPAYPAGAAPYGMQPPMFPQSGMPEQGYPMQQAPQQAMPAQGYPMQQTPQQQPWGIPPRFSGNAHIGSRLNLLSSQQAMPINQGYPPVGRRLNIQEGY